jgi:hypothetical protein
MKTPDINLKSFYEESGAFLLDFPIVADKNIADALKLSNCHDIQIAADLIVGGYEDCIDINRGRDIYVRITQAQPQGKFVATIKGGAENVLLQIDRLIGHGTETDIDIGNWSDQEPHARTKFVYLNITTSDGSPVRVRILHGWTPILINSAHQKYIISTRYKGCFNWVYSILKRWKLA